MKKVLLLIDPSRESGRGLLRGIAKYSRFHGEWTFYRKPPIYLEPHLKRRALPRLNNLDVDGVIMIQEPHNEAIVDLGLPTIAVLLTRKQMRGSYRIIGNQVKIVEMAAEHLFSCGFRRFAYCGFDDLYWSVVRAEKFSEKVTEAGFDIHIYKQPRSRVKRLWRNERFIVADWLKSLPKPVGLLSCNDERGQDVIMACRIADLEVPDEVAVLGIDNDTIVCELCKPPLSSVALNYERAGYQGAELLDKLMVGKEVKKQMVFIQPTYVVARQSTDILASEDRLVAEAIRFIREHAYEPIQVSDVVEAVPLSRRSLYERFHKILGRGVNEEIRRLRIEKVAQMLVETNLTVSQIAAHLEFMSADHIARYFREEKGMSPLEYRKQYGRP